MLALATTNVVGVVLFAGLYVAAGARLMSQGVFLLVLVVLVGLVTAAWVRVESRHRALHPRRRAGRIAAALLVVVGGVAVFSLIPAFWLDARVPRDAPFAGHFTPLVALTVVSLSLVVLVNVAGAALVIAHGVLRARPKTSIR